MSSTSETRAEKNALQGAAPRVNGINHILFHTNDMEKTAQFYGGVLGLNIRVAWAPGPAYRSSVKRLYFFELANGDNLAFIEVSDPMVSESPFVGDLHWAHVPKNREAKPRSFNHIMFDISSDTELEALKARLENAGYGCSELMDTDAAPFVRSFFLYDPNGIPIEFGRFYDPAAAGKKPDWIADPDPVPFLKQRQASSAR